MTEGLKIDQLHNVAKNIVLPSLSIVIYNLRDVNEQAHDRSARYRNRQDDGSGSDPQFPADREWQVYAGSVMGREVVYERSRVQVRADVELENHDYRDSRRR